MQSKLLEEKLQSYIHPLERSQGMKEDLKQYMSALYPNNIYKPIVIDLEPSVFDKIIYLKCNKYECLRRAFGRRINTDGLLFHIHDDVPPLNESPLVENLIPEEDY